MNPCSDLLGPVEFESREQMKYEVSPLRETKVLGKFDRWARAGRHSECIFYLQRTLDTIPLELAVLRVAA